MTYTIVGCNDEQTVCDCCGKAGLKKTVILRDEDGEFFRYGSTCAVKATTVRGARTKAELDRTILAANAEVAKRLALLSMAAGNLTDEARFAANFARMSYRVSAGDFQARLIAEYADAADRLHAMGVAC